MFVHTLLTGKIYTQIKNVWAFLREIRCAFNIFLIEVFYYIILAYYYEENRNYVGFNLEN